MGKTKLFCFPYAGGSATIFNKWRGHLDSNIELIPVELKGRGKRIHEGQYRNVEEVIEDVFHIVKEQIPLSHYALFGHSMGGMIAYELAQRIKEEGLGQPLHIFFSGRRAPHVKKVNDKKYHLLNDTDFKKEIIQLGGTPPEFFDHPELMQLFLPLLKNDFRIAETANDVKQIKPLEGNITIFSGRKDDYTVADCNGWSLHTKKKCRINFF